MTQRHNQLPYSFVTLQSCLWCVAFLSLPLESSCPLQYLREKRSFFLHVLWAKMQNKKLCFPVVVFRRPLSRNKAQHKKQSEPPNWGFGLSPAIKKAGWFPASHLFQRLWLCFLMEILQAPSRWLGSISTAPQGLWCVVCFFRQGLALSHNHHAPKCFYPSWKSLLGTAMPAVCCTRRPWHLNQYSQHKCLTTSSKQFLAKHSFHAAELSNRGRVQLTLSPPILLERFLH